MFKQLMIEKTLTIVVPAYNSEDYLERCLDSFCLAEVLPKLDIIIVNDGSKDLTSVIAHKYAKVYPYSFRVVDKENGGHGSVINCAIQLAYGKYFLTVDSDDWVITNNLPKLLRTLESISSDVILSNYHMVDMLTGRRMSFETKEIPLEKKYTIEEFITYPRNSRNCCFFHGIIYCTEFYRTTGIRLSEGTYYEDQEYATLPFYFAENIFPTGIFLYQYQVGNINQSISNQNQVKNMSQIESVLFSICDFYQSHKDMSQGKKDYFLFKMTSLLASYYVAGLLKDSDKVHGKMNVERIYKAVHIRCPDLAVVSENRYRICILLSRLHISADSLERAKRTKLYHVLQRFL